MAASSPVMRSLAATRFTYPRLLTSKEWAFSHRNVSGAASVSSAPQCGQRSHCARVAMVMADHPVSSSVKRSENREAPMTMMSSAPPSDSDGTPLVGGLLVELVVGI